MREMTLRNLAAACGGELHLPEKEDWAATAGGEAGFPLVSAETEIESAVQDSRQAGPGALFFAVVGERVDGHRFIESVFQAGAACVVTEKTPEQVEAEHGIPAARWGAYLLVEDSLQALREIAAFYRSTLRIPVVGVTGSVGKTSTKEFIAGVLSTKYRVLKTEGNYNNEIGVPLTLLRIREEHEAAVVEMGISDFGEMHRLSKMVRPTICVITNIGQCHLENLKTRDGILKAKTEIFDYMDPEGEVCLNGEDDKLVTVREVNGRPVHFFGLGGNPDEEVWADEVESRGLFGSRATLHFAAAGQAKPVEIEQPEADMVNAAAAVRTKPVEIEQPEADMVDGAAAVRTIPVEIPLPGAHMVVNAAAAACVGRLLGLTDEEIAAGIGRTEPMGGRSRLIRLADRTLIDDCYNANPVSMRAAIDLLAMADTRKAAVLGDMLDLGEDSVRLHRETGAYAARAGVDLILCIGEKGRQIYEGAWPESQEGQRVIWFENKRAFWYACVECGKYRRWFGSDCTILIKASHAMGFSELVEMLSGEQKGE